MAQPQAQENNARSYRALCSISSIALPALSLINANLSVAVSRISKPLLAGMLAIGTTACAERNHDCQWPDEDAVRLELEKASDSNPLFATALRSWIDVVTSPSAAGPGHSTNLPRVFDCHGTMRRRCHGWRDVAEKALEFVRRFA